MALAAANLPPLDKNPVSSRALVLRNPDLIARILSTLDNPYLLVRVSTSGLDMGRLCGYFVHNDRVKPIITKGLVWYQSASAMSPLEVPELLSYVLQFLPNRRELHSAARVCSFWREVASNETLREQVKQNEPLSRCKRACVRLGMSVMDIIWRIVLDAEEKEEESVKGGLLLYQLLYVAGCLKLFWFYPETRIECVESEDLFGLSFQMKNLRYIDDLSLREQKLSDYVDRFYQQTKNNHPRVEIYEAMAREGIHVETGTSLGVSEEYSLFYYPKTGTSQIVCRNHHSFGLAEKTHFVPIVDAMCDVGAVTSAAYYPPRGVERARVVAAGLSGKVEAMHYIPSFTDMYQYHAGLLRDGGSDVQWKPENVYVAKRTGGWQKNINASHRRGERFADLVVLEDIMRASAKTRTQIRQEWPHKLHGAIHVCISEQV